MKQAPDEVLTSIELAIGTRGNLGMMLNGTTVPVAPQDHAAWTKALKRTLTPEQLAVWEKSEAEEKQRLTAEIGDRVKEWVQPLREPLQDSMLSKAADVIKVLNLPGDRADQLKTFAKKAVEESLSKMTKREEEWLATMDDESRRQMLKNRRIYFSPNPDEAPQGLPVWKTGLAKLLSADEQKRLDAEASVHKARRAHALARLMLARLDEKVALTTSQRERLAPICEELAEKNVDNVFTLSVESYVQVDGYGTLTSALKSKDTEIQAVLEPVQWRHWLDACEIAAEGQQNRFQRRRNPLQKEAKPTNPPEPEESEQAISDYLDGKAQAMRRRVLGEFLLRAEDAGRAANLPVEKIERLKTAARGAVDLSLTNWKSSTDQMVRANIGDSSPRFIRLRLEGMERYNFQSRLLPPPETQALWTNAFKTELDAPQIAAAEKVAKERKALRSDAIAGFVIAMYDMSLPITPEQQAKIEPAVSKMITEYESDILGFFSSDNSDWYLSTYSMFVPVAAIPEADFKSILGPEAFRPLDPKPTFRSRHELLAKPQGKPRRASEIRTKMKTATLLPHNLSRGLLCGLMLLAGFVFTRSDTARIPACVSVDPFRPKSIPSMSAGSPGSPPPRTRMALGRPVIRGMA